MDLLPSGKLWKKISESKEDFQNFVKYSSCLSYYVRLTGGKEVKIMKSMYRISLIIVMVLLLALPAFAQSTKSTSTENANTSGDISVMYYGATLDTGINGVGSRTASGFCGDANVYFAKRWGIGIDYTTNNVTMGRFPFIVNNQWVNVNIPDFTVSNFGAKLKYQLTDPSPDGALRIYLLWRNLNTNWSGPVNNVMWTNVGYNASGLGGGLDGFVKMGQKWEAYGMADWASLNGNTLGVGINASEFCYEAGVKYYFSSGFFGRLGWRGESYNFNQNGWGGSNLNGYVVGVGVKF